MQPIYELIGNKGSVIYWLVFCLKCNFMFHTEKRKNDKVTKRCQPYSSRIKEEVRNAPARIDG